MPVRLTFLDVIPPLGRGQYIDSLARVGISSTDDDSPVTVVASDDGRICVCAEQSDDVSLSREIHPDDLAQIIKCVVELSDARSHLRALVDVEHRALQVGAIVHDANNALVAILFAARELRDLGSDASDLAQHVLDSANHIATMFRSLLTPMVTSPASLIDVNVAVADALRLLVHTGREVPITVQLTPGIPSVAIHANDLERVLTNLVANAREAAVDYSPITIATSAVHLAEPDLWDLPAGRWVLIEVRDAGAGMDEQTLRHATDPFFTTKSSTSGTGLGLFSAHRLVRQAGGHLRIDSAEAVGTCVQIFLPARA